MKPTPFLTQRAAEAIANARAMRRGAPPISNVLDLLPPKLLEEVTEDAEEALTAALPDFSAQELEFLIWALGYIRGVADEPNIDTARREFIVKYHDSVLPKIQGFVEK